MWLSPTRWQMLYRTLFECHHHILLMARWVSAYRSLLVRLIQLSAKRPSLMLHSEPRGCQVRDVLIQVVSHTVSISLFWSLWLVWGLTGSFLRECAESSVCRMAASFQVWYLCGLYEPQKALLRTGQVGVFLRVDNWIKKEGSKNTLGCCFCCCCGASNPLNSIDISPLSFSSMLGRIN